MQQRFEYLDIAKGIGIIMVVVGHMISNKGCIGLCINSIHMPLFFIISGLCFNANRNAKFIPFVKKRFRQIMIPCFVFTIICGCLQSSLIPDYRYLLGEIPGALWFLVALFGASIVFHVINQHIEKMNVSIYVISIIVLFTIGRWLYIADFTPPHLQYLTTIPIATAFYEIGFLFQKYKLGNLITTQFANRFMLLPSIGILLIPFAYALLTKDDLVFVNNKINASNGSLSILGVFSILAVSNIMTQFKNTRWLVWLGKNTLPIMAVHVTIIELSVCYLKSDIYPAALYKIVEFSIVWIISIGIAYLLNKYLPFIIGK